MAFSIWNDSEKMWLVTCRGGCSVEHCSVVAEDFLSGTY